MLNVFREGTIDLGCIRLNLVVYPESQGFEKQASDNAKLCFVSYLLALAVLPVTFSLLSGLVG